ncbi:Uncharacterised protein [Serratia plymuthica]|uniref:Uncharacterized protein n=1 Tax=Serratia plymuthica TaxID=82996 RepID=A0A2X4UND9_SERPL|nr:Uncharacterised protein [Serratia plymuthica]
MPSGITKPKAAFAETSRLSRRLPPSATDSCWGWAPFADEALNTALTARAGVFNASHACYHVLFPIMWH